jgi:hypothetical protein
VDLGFYLALPIGRGLLCARRAPRASRVMHEVRHDGSAAERSRNTPVIHWETAEAATRKYAETRVRTQSKPARRFGGYLVDSVETQRRRCSSSSVDAEWTAKMSVRRSWGRLVDDVDALAGPRAGSVGARHVPKARFTKERRARRGELTGVAIARRQPPRRQRRVTRALVERTMLSLKQRNPCVTLPKNDCTPWWISW